MECHGIGTVRERGGWGGRGRGRVRVRVCVCPLIVVLCVSSVGIKGGVLEALVVVMVLMVVREYGVGT